MALPCHGERRPSLAHRLLLGYLLRAHPRFLFKVGDLDERRALGRRVGGDDELRYVLFSPSGCDPQPVTVARAEGILIVTPDEMFREEVANA